LLLRSHSPQHYPLLSFQFLFVTFLILYFGNGFPGGHFWVNNLTLGDGLAAFGLVIGCYCAGVALCATAITHMTLQPRSSGWALISIIIAAMITLAATGVYQQG